MHSTKKIWTQLKGSIETEHKPNLGARYLYNVQFGTIDINSPNCIPSTKEPKTCG